jgi:hypothetical protein
LTLENGPQTGLEVVPCHIGGVGEVHEGAVAENINDCDAGCALARGEDAVERR